MSAEQGHTMHVVVRRTGLRPHVIRVWEKRYGAVAPSRAPTRRRLYTDAAIQQFASDNTHNLDCRASASPSLPGSPGRMRVLPIFLMYYRV